MKLIFDNLSGVRVSDEKGKRCKYAAAPATVSEDEPMTRKADHWKTGKDRVLMTHQSVDLPVKYEFLPSVGRECRLLAEQLAPSHIWKGLFNILRYYKRHLYKKV